MRKDATAWNTRDATWSMVITGIDADPNQADFLKTWGRAYVPSDTARRGTLRRQIPKVGARCVNHARRDLCGGCSAMSIPTAIAHL